VLEAAGPCKPAAVQQVALQLLLHLVEIDTTRDSMQAIMQRDWQPLFDVMLGQSGGLCSVSHATAAAAAAGQAPATATCTAPGGLALKGSTSMRAGCCDTSAGSDSKGLAAAATAAAGIIQVLASRVEGQQQLATASTVRLLLLAALPADSRQRVPDVDSSSTGKVCAPCSTDTAAVSVTWSSAVAGHAVQALISLAQCDAGYAYLLKHIPLLLAVLDSLCRIRQQSLALQQDNIPDESLRSTAQDASWLLAQSSDTPEGLRKLCSDRQLLHALLQCLESSRGSGYSACVGDCAKVLCWVAVDDAGCLLLCDQRCFDEIMHALQDTQLEFAAVQDLFAAMWHVLNRVSCTVGDSITTVDARLQQLLQQGQGPEHAADVAAAAAAAAQQGAAQLGAAQGTAVVLQRWHIEALVRIAEISQLTRQTVELLAQGVGSGRADALLLRPFMRRLHASARLLRSLSEVGFGVGHPAGDDASGFEASLRGIDAVAAAQNSVDYLHSRSRHAAAFVQEVLLPSALLDFKEALVCCAGARMHFACGRGASTVGVASVLCVEGAGAGGGRTYTLQQHMQQQQLEGALDAVVVSSCMYHCYQDKLFGCM
jgi:hypothetical protein